MAASERIFQRLDGSFLADDVGKALRPISPRENLILLAHIQRIITDRTK
jgi:hypothetical protein